MSSQISEEESNYLKVVFVLLRIATPLVRVKFDNEVHPIQLKKVLDKSRRNLQRFLNQEQMDLLFPKTGDPTSRTFDITLMILLLKHLTQITISDVLPYQTHTDPGAHLSRIKFYRNMISHSEHGTISKTYFAECWENISMAVVGLGGDQKQCDEFKAKIFSVYELSFMPDEIELKNELSEVFYKVIGIVENVTSNEFQDEEDDFGASDDHKRLWSLFTDTGKQVLYHFVEIRIRDIHDETDTLHQFLDKHKNLFHQPCCPCGKQICEDEPFDKPYETKCFPEYFNNINVSVENCPLNDLIGYLVKTGKCNEEEKNWFETILHTTQAKTSWDDLEKIEYLAEPIRYKNIVQLQINTLKMVVEEYKSLYQKRKKRLLSHKEDGSQKREKGQNLITLENDAYMEKFDNRSAIIKINRRKLENTEEWNVTISTEGKKAKMRIDGLTEGEEIKILDYGDIQQCETGTASSLTIVNVRKGSIQLYLSAAPNVFKSHKSFKSAIRSVIQRVLEVGQVDTSTEGTLYIQVTIDRGESIDKIGVVQQLIYENIMDEDSERGYYTEEKEELRTNHGELEEAANRIKEENEDLQGRLNQTNEANEELQTKNKKLEDTANRLKEENVDLHNRIREQSENLLHQLNEANEEKEELQTNYIELEEAAKRIKEENEEFHNRISEQLKDRLNKMNETKEENKELHAKNRKLEDTANLLKEENENLQNKVRVYVEYIFNQLNARNAMIGELQQNQMTMVDLARNVINQPTKMTLEYLARIVRYQPNKMALADLDKVPLLDTDHAHQGEYRKPAAENTFPAILEMFLFLAQLAVLAGVAKLSDLLAVLEVIPRYVQGEYIGSAHENHFQNLLEDVEIYGQGTAINLSGFLSRPINKTTDQTDSSDDGTDAFFDIRAVEQGMTLGVKMRLVTTVINGYIRERLTHTDISYDVTNALLQSQVIELQQDSLLDIWSSEFIVSTLSKEVRELDLFRKINGYDFYEGKEDEEYLDGEINYKTFYRKNM